LPATRTSLTTKKIVSVLVLILVLIVLGSFGMEEGISVCFPPETRTLGRETMKPAGSKNQILGFKPSDFTPLGFEQWAFFPTHLAKGS
jgi:hypothetical protein